MPTWLLILIVGIILLVLGFTGVAEILIWIGIAVLVVSLILALLGRGKATRV